MLDLKIGFMRFTHTLLKGIVSRDLNICFLVPFDRSTSDGALRLLSKIRFRVEFFDFRNSA
jgi:hypothetical protein